MLDPQASRFWQAALRSGLLDEQGLTACWNAIPPAKQAEPEHLDRRLARQAVHSHLLTQWQSQQLLAGRSTGYKVDRYVLLELIGQGGMGRVFLARDTRLNRRVALKILSPERMNNPRAIARFKREARVGAQLQHENLVRIYDCGESNGRFFLVMEYIEGKTIGAMLMEQGPMPPAAAARLIRQVARGLEHAHRKRLIHRDVNPYNILVTRDGVAKLADLGLARDLGEQDRVTREDGTVGTFDYVAPEQARQAHAADIRSDIYALGCTLYHMLSGQVPFPSSSLSEKLLAHQAIDPTPLQQLRPGLPAALADVVARMMRKSPDERFATPLQVAQALEPYEDAGTDARDIRPPSPPATSTAGERSPTSSEVIHQLAAEPSPGLVKAAAAPRGPEISSDVDARATTSVDSRTSAVEPTTPSPAPAHELEPAGPEFPLVLNLGPEPPLSQGLSRPKGRFGSFFGSGADAAVPNAGAEHPAVSTKAKAAPVSQRRGLWLWELAALTVILTGSVLVLTLGHFLNRTAGRTTNRLRPAPDAAPQTNGPLAERSLNAQRELIPVAAPTIAVRTEGEDIREFRNLLDAMNTALGNPGAWVELRNQEPLRLPADQTLDFLSGRGNLRMRAAAGFTPVIALELTGSKPFLRTGSAISVELDGLTFIAQAPQQAASATFTAPALVATAGKLTVKRCAFRLVGSPPLKGSRAIYCDGGVLSVDRSWFEGFDEAVDLAAYPGTAARVSQTMIVPASGRAPKEPQGPEFYGWGVKLEPISQASSRARSQLSLEHCTLEGAGLLELVEGPAAASFFVEVRHCAVRGNALLAWKPRTPGSSLAKKLRWAGLGNQFEILGRSWVVLSASQGTPALSSEVTDLESWARMVGQEIDPFRAKLTYHTDPATRSSSLQPKVFAVEGASHPGAKPGADPELVGPWSK
jgi:serine/threonine-protein kinase